MSSNQSGKPKLVADIGGTNARFGLTWADALPRNVQTLAASGFATIVDAIEHYLAQAGGERPGEAAIAVASPITGDEVKMTNNDWVFSIEATRRALKLERLLVLNDFTALALALPHLARDELQQIGGGVAVADAPIALIGAGTGLGVSGLIPARGDWVPIQGEGGHTSLSPANTREADILRIVWREYPHVSFERLVSGIGFDNLYRAIAELEGKPGAILSPAAITARALDGSDSVCAEVLQTFCAMLGTAAANLALTLGARGGVYVGGGIVPKLGEYFVRSPFRARFEDKGRYASYLAAIPTYVIHAKDPALIGAAQALTRRWTPLDDDSRSRENLPHAALP